LTKRALSFSLVCLAGAGCDKASPGANPETAPADCFVAGGDSARAICVAVDTLSRGYGLASRPLRVAAESGGFRVVTVPDDSNTVDGMAVVEVDASGRVQSVVLTDSAP
jgi:hypothetical protein